MAYKAAVTELQFLLEHIVDMPELAQNAHFSHATPDLIDAILAGAAQLAENEYAATLRVCDENPPLWQDGKVSMPAACHTAYQAYVQGGWGSIDGPADYGGQGLPFSIAAMVMEMLGTANMGFSLINVLTPGAIHALMAYGTQQQQATWLPKLVTGEWNGTMNLTEASAGSDVGALRTMAVPVDEGPDAGLWKISGQKIFITFGEHDLTENIVHLVLARTPDAPAGTRGVSLFLVPKFRLDAAGKPTLPNGTRCLSLEHKMGIHASPTCLMAYGDDGDTLGELVGDIGGGMKAMFIMMNNARLMVGGQGVQVAERATQQALAYAAERVQSARASAPGAGPVAIIEHPDVRRMLLRMRALTQGARALIHYAAGQLDRGQLGDEAANLRAHVLIPLAKAWPTDIGSEVASLGMQVHGGMGYIEETGAAQHYRDVRVSAIYEGTNGIQAADLVGRKLDLGEGRPLDLLIADIKNGAADEPHLQALADAVADVAVWMRGCAIDDRLAGSVDFLAMMATATAGWLMARQHTIAHNMLARGEGDPAFLKVKSAAARFFLDRIVPEALGRKAGAMAGADGLYGLSAMELAEV